MVCTWQYACGLAMLLAAQLVGGQNHSALPRPAVRLALGQRVERRLLSASSSYADSPLYPGYGTHFAYIYVGTPPQRVSVIIDTGSHYTSFPCTGCQNCGTHTDPYFDPTKSSTTQISTCGQSKCEFRQSYSEGSSWVAYKIVDKLWVGAEKAESLEISNFAVDFMFGCQTSQTGLFRTQLADGIMGMSAQGSTLVPQLKSKGVLQHNLFGLCFKDGGGSMTLGGIDRTTHKGEIQYVPMLKPTGWYTIKLLDVLIGGKTIGVPSSKYNTGKGIIVDSGTTDTYLPTSIRTAFGETMLAVAGIGYSTGKLVLTESEYLNLPSITFVFDHDVRIVMPPTSYMDRVAKDRYMFRVYLTEGSGGVLGANFMKDFDVIFDMENHRVGFVPADCEYVYHNVPPPPAPAPAPSVPALSPLTPATPLPAECVYSDYLPLSRCNATCSSYTSGTAVGFQRWGKQLLPVAATNCPAFQSQSMQPCSLACSKGTPVHGVASCVISPWSKCDSVCTQQREVGTVVENSDEKLCRRSIETRECNIGLCPNGIGDYFVILDMKLSGMSPLEWIGGAIKDDYRTAVAQVLDISEGAIELMASSDTSAGATPVSHLQFQVHLAKEEGESGSVLAFQKATELHDLALSPQFPPAFVAAINRVGLDREMSSSKYTSYLAALQPRVPNVSGRYGWIKETDILVSHVSAIPISTSRDPIEIPQFTPEAEPLAESPMSAITAVFTGLAVVSLVVAGLVMFVNHRSRSRSRANGRIEPNNKHSRNGRRQENAWELRRLTQEYDEEEELSNQL